jgi:hypothetical protein
MIFQFQKRFGIFANDLINCSMQVRIKSIINLIEYYYINTWYQN